MESDLDAESLVIKCPHCGKTFEERIARLKYHLAMSCPLCRKYMGIDSLTLEAVLESALKTMDELFKRLLITPK